VTLPKPRTGAVNARPSEGTSGLPVSDPENQHPLAKEGNVALLILLALIVALFIGLGFVVKWLFIIAVIAALLWLIAFFTRGARA
jgi:hypothetical protein